MANYRREQKPKAKYVNISKMKVKRKKPKTGKPIRELGPSANFLEEGEDYA